MKLVFFIFKESLLALNHVDNLFSSVLSFWINSRKSLPDANKLVSSAKRIKYKKSEQLVISFIYKIKRRGPRIYPWGTPQTIGIKEDS